MAQPSPSDTVPPASGVWTHETGIYSYGLWYNVIGGRVEVVAVRLLPAVVGQALRAEALRAFPLGRMADKHRPEMAKLFADFLAQADWLTELEQRDALELLVETTVPASRPGGRPRISAERLAEVARVYTEAWTAGERNDPARAVLDHFRERDNYEWSEHTIPKWIARAREEGYLPPAVAERRAGFEMAANAPKAKEKSAKKKPAKKKPAAKSAKKKTTRKRR